MNKFARGFSLIEMMVVVAIVGILTAIALPSYRDHVTRARLTDAFSGLATIPAQMEQYWPTGRTFENFDRMPADTVNFTFRLTSASQTAYTVTATGVGNAAGFVYTIDQSGARATTSVPSGWTANSSCWVDGKGGTCTQ